MFGVLSELFITSSVLFALSIVSLGVKNLYGKDWDRLEDNLYTLAFLFSALNLVQLYYPSLSLQFLIEAIILATTLCILQYAFSDHSAAGLFFYGANVLLSIIGVLWGTVFLFSIDVSITTRVLMLVTAPLLLFTLPFGFLQMIEQFDVLCRKRWHRPRSSIKNDSLQYAPMVSLHVPTYAEPPQIVIETLDRIKELRYANYEVLLIDNNTKDESLWRPLEEHCRKLGPRFRFFHVDPLAGAKAGALNFALAHTSKEAEIVGIIDSDYHPDPNFIADLIRHFQDPRVGFVQTPHDYRDWESNSYLRMCYWEYKAFFHTILVALNERDAALTIGTMCLLRKDAIQKSGGWAMWCVTEDSELAIRIHDAGYSSVYVETSYGKGLIPERFVDYAMQRYRWIAGPVQELKHHFWHFVGRSGKKSQFTFPQRLHHFNHGFGSTMFGLNIPVIVLTIAVCLSMLMHREIIAVPLSLWISVTVLFFSNIALNWLQFRVILKASFKEMLLGMLAHKALTHTVNTAALKTAISSSQTWHRTSKFKHAHSLLNALQTVFLESGIGILLLSASVLMYLRAPFPGILTMCLLGILYKSFDYLAAPVVSVIATHSQKSAKRVYSSYDGNVRSTAAARIPTSS